MNRVSYHIELRGLKSSPGTIDVIALRDVLDALIDAAGKALRLTVEGTSTRRGQKPAWMEDSVRFVVTGMQEGSTILPIEVPQLAETAALVVQQQDMWLSKPELEDTSLTVLARAVEDVKTADRDSERYDRGVLDAIAKFGRVVHNGEAVTIRNTETGASTFDIQQEHIQHAKQLKRDTPDPQAVVLSGTLSMIRDKPRTFQLRTKEGQNVRGNVEGGTVEAERLRDLWRKKVTVRGMAHFTPAGTLRFIEANVIRPFGERDQLFERTKQEIEREAKRQRPLSTRDLQAMNAGPGVQKIRGTWPGDESIDDILDALD